MLKVLNYIFVIGPLLIFYMPRLIYFRIRKDKISRIKLFKHIKRMAVTLTKAFHVNLICEGQENLSSIDSFLLVGNHQSMYDPVFILATSKDVPIYFVAKKESKKLPFIGMFIKTINGIFMDRGNRRQEVKVMKEIRNRLNNDSCAVCIFPEGTRTKNNDYTVNDFHPGSFNVAMKERKPIVPFIIEGSYFCFGITKKLKHNAYIKYLKPIFYEGYKNLSTNEIAKIIQDRITIEQEKLHKLI